MKDPYKILGVSKNASDEEIEKIISETNYGKCIFKCGNDVVDHQVVQMEFADGCTANLTMNIVK